MKSSPVYGLGRASLRSLNPYTERLSESETAPEQIYFPARGRARKPGQIEKPPIFPGWE
jgi:hypothetical protein